jgi:hypothetical protein
MAAKSLLLAQRQAVRRVKNFSVIYIHLFATRDELVAHVSHVCIGKTINCVTTPRYCRVRVSI